MRFFLFYSGWSAYALSGACDLASRQGTLASSSYIASKTSNCTGVSSIISSMIGSLNGDADDFGHICSCANLQRTICATGTNLTQRHPTDEHWLEPRAKVLVIMPKCGHAGLLRYVFHFDHDAASEQAIRNFGTTRYISMRERVVLRSLSDTE